MARGGFQTYYKSREKVLIGLRIIMTISLFCRASTRGDLEKCCAATMEEWRILV